MEGEDDDDDSELDEDELMSDDDEVNWAFISFDMFRLLAISNISIRMELNDFFYFLNGNYRVTKRKEKKRRTN